MEIIMQPAVYAILETIVSRSGHSEFSGFGYCKLEEDNLVIYDFKLMAWGSSAFTEMSKKRIAEVAERDDAKNMRVWVHKHPVGNGVPGPHNWSGTDNDTCKNNPLGSYPGMVKWAAAIVRTPQGWVGRIDTYEKKIDNTNPQKPEEKIDQKTVHVKVKIPIPDSLFAEIEEVKKEWQEANQNYWQKQWQQRQQAWESNQQGQQQSFFRGNSRTYQNYYGVSHRGGEAVDGDTQTNHKFDDKKTWYPSSDDYEQRELFDLSEARGATPVGYQKKIDENQSGNEIDESSEAQEDDYGTDVFVILSDIYDRYIACKELRPDEIQLMKDMFYVINVPDAKHAQQLEDTPDDYKYTNQEWIILQSYWQICDEMSILSNEILEFEISQLSQRLASGAFVSEEDRNFLIMQLGVNDYTLLLEKRMGKKSGNGWLDRPMLTEVPATYIPVKVAEETDE